MSENSETKPISGAEPQVIELKSWSEFDEKINWLKAYKKECEVSWDKNLQEPLFRGHGNSDWPLQTTLERSFPLDRSDSTLSLLSYYRKVSAARPAVETLTDRLWVDVPEFHVFQKLLKKHHGDWLDSFLSKHIGIYRYLIYLRHHGFPSPLLDWTASPYVAALFAFDSIDSNAKQVCVYAYLQSSLWPISASDHFFIVGPYLQTHPRHFLQQSRYSLCVGVAEDDYVFRPHQSAMVGRSSSKLIRFEIPATERTTALKNLDLMNINPYSLFGSEDALIRTVSRRECLFKDWGF